MINLREDTSLIVCAVRYALGRESYISHTVPAEVKLILPQVTDGILAALRNDVSDWLVRHRDNWTAGDWDKLYEAVVKEQGYINQLSEHTVVVTDRSLDDVQQEILDSMDVVR